MSWRDRLRGQIQLTSPDGDVFNAKWIGNDRSKEKKIGKFDYPNFDGSVIQDLGVNGISYPLTIHFDGDDNDLEGERFFTACNQKGLWSIIHPVKGNLSLQLISVSEQIRPVESGGITIFETSWIEPTNELNTVSSAQLGANTAISSTDTNIQSASQYNDSLSVDTASELIANEQAVNGVLLSADNSFEGIVALSETISAELAAINNGIQETLAAKTLDALSLAGQIQSYIESPFLTTQDIQARVDAYVRFVVDILPKLPDGNTTEDKNTALVNELSLGSAMVGISQSITTGELSTRSQAVSYIDTITELFNDIIDSLDIVQDNFKNNNIDFQYYSNLQSYADLTKLVGIVIAYLLKSSLDLKIEKRFILDRQRSPIEITVKEYGELGENDSNLDFFISTNELIGDEIRLIPAGSEVVVYV